MLPHLTPGFLTQPSFSPLSYLAPCPPSLVLPSPPPLLPSLLPPQWEETAVITIINNVNKCSVLKLTGISLLLSLISPVQLCLCAWADWKVLTDTHTRTHTHTWNLKVAGLKHTLHFIVSFHVFVFSICFILCLSCSVKCLRSLTHTPHYIWGVKYFLTVYFYNQGFIKNIF